MPDNGSAVERVESTGDRVLRISAELFAANGFDATGVQQISEATGLGRGALYYHLKSKQDVLFRIATNLLDRITAEARMIVEGEGSVQVRLRELARHLTIDLAESRDSWTIAMRDWQALSPEQVVAVGAKRDDYESLWQALFDEGHRLGEWPEVSPVVRRGVLGMFTASYRWIDRSGPLSPREIADEFVGTIMVGITGRPG